MWHTAKEFLSYLAGETMRECPSCHRPIDDDEALLCHFCGSSLRRASRGAMGKLRYQYRWLFGALTALVVLGFFFAMIF
jgi:predicted amidophosphoribosyltransferase